MKIIFELSDELIYTLDKRAKEEERNRSQIIRLAIKNYLNIKKEPIVNNEQISTTFKVNHLCQPPGTKCFNTAVGKYLVMVNDPLEGDKEFETYLCQTHLDKAGKEGDVSKIED